MEEEELIDQPERFDLELELIRWVKVRYFDMRMFWNNDILDKLCNRTDKKWDNRFHFVNSCSVSF